jgi:hypothetical protein
VSGVDATAAHIHTAAGLTFGGTDFAVNYAANAIVVPPETPKSGASRGCTSAARAVGEALRPTRGTST